MSAAFVAELRRQGGALAELAAAPATPPGPRPTPAGGRRPARRRARAGVRAAARDDLRGIAASLRRAPDRPPDDPDLALLLGDQLYALGLSRLAELGDLDAVAELADVISLVAQAQAAGDGDLSDAVWEAGAVAVGWGCTPRIRAAKAAARAHDPARRRLQAAAASARGGPADSPPPGL